MVWIRHLWIATCVCFSQVSFGFRIARDRSDQVVPFKHFNVVLEVLHHGQLGVGEVADYLI